MDSVYHWNISTIDDTETSTPQFLFNLDKTFISSQVQIINYSCDSITTPDIIGFTAITLNNGTPTVLVQMNSLNGGWNQVIEAYNFCFGRFPATHQQIRENKLGHQFVAIIRSHENALTLFITDTHKQAPGNQKLFHIQKNINDIFSSEDKIFFIEYISHYGLIYIASQLGTIAVFEALSGNLVASKSLSDYKILKIAPDHANGGILACSKDGTIFSVTPKLSSITSCLRNRNMATEANALADACGYPESFDKLERLYRELFEQGNFNAAAKVCVLDKSLKLRNNDTISNFRKAVGKIDKPFVVYFRCALETPGKLTHDELTELIKPVFTHKRMYMLEDWLERNKIECTEQLANQVAKYDDQLALRIAYRAKAWLIVLLQLIKLNMTDQISQYIPKECNMNIQTAIEEYLNKDVTIAKEFARTALSYSSENYCPRKVIMAFLEKGYACEAAEIYASVLAEKEIANQEALETAILEALFITDVKSAQLAINSGSFKMFDKSKIASLCEKNGLFDEALLLYNDPADLARILTRSNTAISDVALTNACSRINSDQLASFAEQLLSRKSAVGKSLIRVLRNTQPAEILSTLGSIFDRYSSAETFLFYLQETANPNSPMFIRLIKELIKQENWNELKRVLSEQKDYNVDEVRSILESSVNIDPSVMIIFYSQFKNTDKLVMYLRAIKHVDTLINYCENASATSATEVILTLLAQNAEDNLIVSAMKAIKGCCDVVLVTKEFEKYGRTALIKDWLEDRVADGFKEPELHLALGKLYIDAGELQPRFFTTNALYDYKALGNYCEKRDVNRALQIYEQGNCFEDLINLCINHGLYKQLACALFKPSVDVEQWTQVLKHPLATDTAKRALFDQINGPQFSKTEDISIYNTMINALEVNKEFALLTDLLERIIVYTALPESVVSHFTENPYYSNLLFKITAISEPSKMSDYATMLPNLNISECADLAIKHGYSDVAASLYSCNGMHIEAINVLLSEGHSLSEAKHYVDQVNEPSVTLLYCEKIINVSLQKLNNSDHTPEDRKHCEALFSEALILTTQNNFNELITSLTELGKKLEKYDSLVEFLLTVRKNGNLTVDYDIAYCLAKSNDLSQLELFLQQPVTLNCSSLADLLYNDNLVAAAKMLYALAGQYADVSKCNLKLGNLDGALASAELTNASSTFADLMKLALQQQNFKVANAAASKLLNSPNEFMNVIEAYKSHGKIDELISLIENQVTFSKFSSLLVTELCILYIDHNPAKFTNYINSVDADTIARTNVARIAEACYKAEMWNEAIVLHTKAQQFENALSLMLQHHQVAFDEVKILVLLKNTLNKELLYKTVYLYIGYYPDKLNNLLNHVGTSINVDRLISRMKSHPRFIHSESLALSPLALAIEFFEKIQPEADVKTSSVNELLNTIYYERNNVEKLNNSVTKFSNFNIGRFAKQLELSELRSMKRIALYLYEKTKYYSHAIELAKKFEHYPEAIVIAARSESQAVIHSLLEFFALELNNMHYFTVCAYLCRRWVTLQSILQLAWISSMTEHILPLVWNHLDSQNDRINKLEQPSTYYDDNCSIHNHNGSNKNTHALTFN